MKVAVTTASGQLGSAIIRNLIPEIGKSQVTGIARSPEKADLQGIEIRKGDYNSYEDFIEALHDIDVVLLVSGMDAPDKRIGQHRNVINAAKKAGVRKIVYTSIFGEPGTSSFDAIVNSNRQTELDVRESGLQWSIGRNGLYIEPDVEYLETYKKEGAISNCAGAGLASYTTRDELAFAYTQMILHNDRNGRIFNLAGDPITQSQLVSYINMAFGTDLVFKDMSPEAYLEHQQKVNGKFLGRIIAGIYMKIRNGEALMRSHYKEAAGRDHKSWDTCFDSLKEKPVK
jgi:NAD(P)H dehydrogenase (quinone)